MSINELLDIGKMVLMVGSLATFFFFYFRNPKFQKIVKQVLVFAPNLFKMVARYVPDEKGVFDTHDLLVLTGRVTERLKTTIENSDNVVFDDVQDEVFDIVRTELLRYKGMEGVPALNDPGLRAQVQVIFEGIQRAISEDS